jgi:hypothetical protein
MNSGDPSEGPTAGYLTVIKTLMDAMMPPLILTVGLSIVTLYPVLDRTYTASPRKVIGYTLRTFWATQRRRGQLSRADDIFPPP